MSVANELLQKLERENTDLRARLAAAESELALVKMTVPSFRYPVEDLIGGPNACDICGRNDGQHYAHG